MIVELLSSAVELRIRIFVERQKSSFSVENIMLRLLIESRSYQEGISIVI